MSSFHVLLNLVSSHSRSVEARSENLRVSHTVSLRAPADVSTTTTTTTRLLGIWQPMAGLVIIVLSLCGHGAVGLVAEYRTCNRKVACSTLTRFTASNLEQVANLLCDQANSASYPQLNGK